MTDTLPSGFTYVPGSAVWSSAPGTALADDGAEPAAAGELTGASCGTNDIDAAAAAGFWAPAGFGTGFCADPAPPLRSTAIVTPLMKLSARMAADPCY